MNTLKIFSVRKLYIISLTLFMYLSGCQTTGEGAKARSIGAPGELLVVMDNDLQKSQVKKIIGAFAHKEFPCVPQPEPTFKLTILTPNNFEGHFKAYRNIVVITQKALSKPSIHFQKNVWAGYQQVVQIEIPDVDSFANIFANNETQMYDFLYYGDIKTMQLANMKGADQATQRFINDKYGLDFVLPRGFRLVKDTADFCWFRFDRLETTMHVVFQSFDLDSLPSINDKDLIHLRDAVGKNFIPGPSELTFMQTEKRLPVVSNSLKINNLDVIELRGLWKVEGFFMGGPFVNYFIKDEANNKLLMIDGFVHAPEKQNKAYYVRQLESILHSVKIL